MTWFHAAGFENVTMTRIGPKWYNGERGHGLIMGCSVTGDKPEGAYGESTLKIDMTIDEGSNEESTDSINIGVIVRSLLGSLGGLYYFFLPIYMWIKYQGKKILQK